MPPYLRIVFERLSGNTLAYVLVLKDLETLLCASHKGGRICNRAVAEALGVRPASSTAMLEKLSRLGLVHHEAHRGVNLSEDGWVLALELARRREVLVNYFETCLGFETELAQKEAQYLACLVSERFLERVARLLDITKT